MSGLKPSIHDTCGVMSLVLINAKFLLLSNSFINVDIFGFDESHLTYNWPVVGQVFHCGISSLVN